MTTIRIAHAEPRPGRLPHGGFDTRGYLVVLADDAGHRAVPIWMQEAGDLARLLKRPAGQIIADGVPRSSLFGCSARAAPGSPGWTST